MEATTTPLTEEQVRVIVVEEINRWQRQLVEALDADGSSRRQREIDGVLGSIPTADELVG